MYRFFQKWCPNIHNALDDDESEDDEMTDPHYCTAEEEVNRLISLFTVFHFSLRSSRSFAYHSVRRFEHIYIFGREFLACNNYVFSCCVPKSSSHILTSDIQQTYR